MDRARALTAGGTRVVHTDGPLIHNEQMTVQLRKERIVECDRPQDLSDDVLMIRAHGIPPARRKMLQGLDTEIADATCPDVAGIHKLIAEYAGKGYSIIIFGDAGHAEVIGLLGCTSGRGHVVERPEDVQSLPELNPVCLVSQTTQFVDSYDRIAEAVRERFRDTVVKDTICRATKNRRKDLVDLAKQTDAIVVVGGSHSANTLRLVELAQTLKPTFHIQTADQLNAGDFRTCRSVGLTAGASTPAFIIQGVKQTLQEMQGQDDPHEQPGNERPAPSIPSR